MDLSPSPSESVVLSALKFQGRPRRHYTMDVRTNVRRPQ